jgi:zinc transport system ATP-binding protein
MSLIISEKSPKSSEEVLSISNLFYRLEGREILKDVNLALSHGEFVTFFGPNGGGKTTLLNLIMGFLQPSSGQIQLCGLPIHKTKGLIGYMPQNFRPDPLFPINVQDVVGLANKKESLYWLERVGMTDYAQASFGSLSGGEAGKVLLARSLAAKPKLLLLDEPVANIDPAARKTIYELLDSFKKETTIIMVTHDLEGALMLSDRFFCVHQTVEEYPKQSLCHHFMQGLYHGKRA